MKDYDDNNIMNEEMDTDDFEKMLEDSLSRTDDFEPGDHVSGTVVFMSGENAFIDISGKSEAVIDINEFKDENDNLTIKAGDSIEAYVVSVGRGEVQLTSRIGRGLTNSKLLEIAYNQKIPIEGILSSAVKGGYNVNISGVRCFCPLSQIDIKVPENPDALLNKTLTFRIIQYGERGRNIVLSRKVILEEENASKIEELKNSLLVGDITEGTVSSIQDFGIFVNIGGTEALVPKSEVSWSRDTNLKNFQLGQKIKAKILSIDWQAQKIAMSIKQMLPEPWESIDSFPEGKAFNGKVTNLISRGAFVELAPGLEGFIHISRMSLTQKINRPEDAISVGNIVNVKILSINRDEKKISLELITDEADPWETPAENLTNTTHRVTVESVKSAGITVRMENGMQGFIPRDDLLQGKSDIMKSYSAGTELTVAVKDMNREKRKLILSEREATRKQEQKDYLDFQEKNDSASGASLGSQFKDKFAAIQKNIEEKK